MTYTLLECKRCQYCGYTFPLSMLPDGLCPNCAPLDAPEAEPMAEPIAPQEANDADLGPLFG